MSVSSEIQRDGLLAELADAMDSKSIAHSSETPEKPIKDEPDSSCLRIACAGDTSDPDLDAVIAAWSMLRPKQRRQLRALVESMIDV